MVDVSNLSKVLQQRSGNTQVCQNFYFGKSWEGNHLMELEHHYQDATNPYKNTVKMVTFQVLTKLPLKVWREKKKNLPENTFSSLNETTQIKELIPFGAPLFHVPSKTQL